jgi:hypothetical protein
MSRATVLELWRERQRPKHAWVCSGAEAKGSLRGRACLPALQHLPDDGSGARDNWRRVKWILASRIIRESAFASATDPLLDPLCKEPRFQAITGN